ncbi:alpha-hydroxy acid oxidase [Aquisalinus flavus]|uniref:Alpha-hydroxy-acid oxidizing enzyme n=1 Tax=Aquisalinus flavus TaxID=1526572 RepID=A0A8J2Y815_9PROT|nr:alpha-hydroxy acid oxidase [Aquisalinus flavus]MBD0426008.1 alpha-hydroxy-acid oxidizing protein [Aquisalinus flavus]UNE48400.1 alpha-hydroxy-acid oxidizing protein [Aquisalinus flavus]GGD11460.1 alpha-hydroxy-acid oxidizing enzyme [Aquisalinus flavus]
MFAGNTDDWLNIEDIRKAARRRAHRMVFDYIDGGSDDERTLAQNRDDFDAHNIYHRVLTGHDKPDTTAHFLGHKLDVPFFLSPAAGNRLFHTDGEAGPALAARDVGTAYSLSTLSSTSIEDIAALTDGPKFFQLYVWKDRGLVKAMLERAKASGYSVLTLTVDFPITGFRERDKRNGFTIPPKVGVKQAWHALNAPFWVWDYLTKPAVKYANLDGDTPAVSLNQFVSEQLNAAFDWRDAEWLLGEWAGKTMIKGVVRSDDAVRALRTGFDAISISNHGGRQLDGSPSPLRALPAIRQKVGDDAPLVLDGGIRRGTDIIKAIALGADIVSFARPYLYGLAANGIPGARHAVQLIADALRRDMVLAGVSSIGEISRDLLHPESVDRIPADSDRLEKKAV